MKIQRAKPQTSQHQQKRRAFLRGRFRETEQVRPPGSTDDFHDLCTQCGDCARACPTGIILRDQDGFPVLDMRAGQCLFCDACAEACVPGAILPATEWPWRASVSSSCLSVQGVSCRSCEDQCDNSAIRFRPMLGGCAQPSVDLDACSGCGACIASCPAGAISLHASSSPKHEEPPC